VPRSPARQSAYERFRELEGQGLLDFATWCALAEVHGGVWATWPEELRDPASPAVAAARADLAHRIDFYCWLQWLADEQLAAAQEQATGAGMPLGIVHDLAVGVHPHGADTWALQDVMAAGVTVGARRTRSTSRGRTGRSRRGGPTSSPRRPTGRTATCSARSSGTRAASGVDHVPGLFRLWWVPEGAPPHEGTYVTYDHEALVGILVLEAWRAGALVVGEDLGVVEPWVRDYLAERGVLGTSILWFEQDGRGRPLPPESWRRAVPGRDDHARPARPTAGYLAGEHVRIRDELGLLTRPVEEERRIDADERRSVAQRPPVARGWLAEEDRDEEQDDRWSPAPRAGRDPESLLGVALTDAVGDRRAINQPGTDDEYPNWRLPLADGSGRPVLLEEIAGSARAAGLAAAVRGTGPSTVWPVTPHILWACRPRSSTTTARCPPTASATSRRC
jgi:4-alpha-glucanotransferase